MQDTKGEQTLVQIMQISLQFKTLLYTFMCINFINVPNFFNTQLKLLNKI